jgi:hypothetical protein
MARTSDNTEVQPRKRTRNQTKTSSSNPPPPNQPPAQPTQTQSPPYKRFTNTEAEERFKVIQELEFTGERAFDLTKLTGYNTFDRMLRDKGWENLNAMVSKTSNKSIAMEFFANAVCEKAGSYVSKVRGKRIKFSPHEINRVLGLAVPEVCDVERRRLSGNWPRSQEEWDGLLAGLMKEGKGWVRKHPTNNPQRVDTADLLPIPRAWASFILSTIVSTSAAAEMILSRAFILLVLFSEQEQMDVGKLIAYNINDMIHKNNALGHSCLINLLCQSAGVLPEPGDILLKSQIPITESTMARLEKKVARAHHQQRISNNSNSTRSHFKLTIHHCTRHWRNTSTRLPIGWTKRLHSY